MLKKIAVLNGDGIGPEIMHEGVKILTTIGELFGHTFELQYAPFGADAYFSTGSCFPRETREVCDEADAILKGPVGLPVDEMNKIPQKDRPEVAAILPLRERYDTFANYRPVYLPAALADFSPLKRDIIKQGVDIMMIRELAGGIYFGEKTEGNDTGMEFAADNCVYRKHEVERIAHVAFNEARERKMPLTNVHKSNVLATSRFWRLIVDDIALCYPDVAYRSMLVDNVAFQLVKDPCQFNGVMLLENMQGDIITDQAGGIIGSLGLMPSVCIGPDKGYVEPSHGSAPDIAGKNIANPYSMIGSVAFLFDKLLHLPEEAMVVWDALNEVMHAGYRTGDLPGADDSKILTTDGFGALVNDYIKQRCA